MTVTFLNSAKIMSLMCAHAAHRGSPSCVCCKVKSNRLHRDQTADRADCTRQNVDAREKTHVKQMTSSWNICKEESFQSSKCILTPTTTGASEKLPGVGIPQKLLPPSIIFILSRHFIIRIILSRLPIAVSDLAPFLLKSPQRPWMELTIQRHGAVPRSLQGAPRILSFTVRRHAHSSPRASTEPPANPREKGPPTHHLRAGASWGGTRFTTALHRQEETQICPCSPRRAHDVHTTRNVMMSEDDAVREIKGSRFSISLN